MAIGTAFIVTAIATAVMAGLAATYYETDGWGAGNKVKSGLDIKKEQEAKKALEKANNIESNGRYFKPVHNSLINQSTQPTQPTRPTQLTKMTLPTVRILPTLSTGYRWQEIQNQTQAQKNSELFVDRYDSKANRGILSTFVNTITDTVNKVETPKNFIEAVSLPIKVLYDLSYSTVDNYIWDLNGDKDSMLKNIFVDPWIEVSEGRANWDQALQATALNALNSFTELFDILANPIKGIANQGLQGFLNGLGIGGQGYVVYDWDTGNFGTDLLAEILSDPLNFAMLAKAPLNTARKSIAIGGKSTAKKITTEGLEAASKEGLQKVLKRSSQEILTDTTTRLAANSAKLSKEAGVELTESASKKINKFLANQLTQSGFTEVNEEVLEEFYKQALKILTTKLDTNKITAYTLRQLDLNSILPDLTKALKKVAKETKDLSLKKAYKAIAKYGIIDNSPKISSIAYLQRFQDIVTDSAENVLIDANTRLALGMSQDLSKVQDEILARASQTLVKANIPVTPANLELLKKAVSEFVRDLDLNSMTAKVLTSMNPTGQKLYMKLDKSIKWLSKIDDDLNVFQKGLGKVALYGTAAPLPILGKALKNTPYGKLVSNRSGEWLKALFAKITNRAAVKFNKAIAEMSQEFTPEAYTAMRKIFMDNTAVASEKLALDLEKGLINPEDFKSLTYTEAFQRGYISKFSQDLEFFDKVLKENESNVEAISRAWESYTLKHYKMPFVRYKNYLEKINQIEQQLTGAAVYAPFLNNIKVNEALLDIYTLNKQLIKTPLITLKQGRTLNLNELKKLSTDAYIISREEYNRTLFELADRQAFIQTHNKAYIQQEIFKELEQINYTILFMEQFFERIYKTDDIYTFKNIKNIKNKNLFNSLKTLKNSIERTNTNSKMFKLLSNPALTGVAGGQYTQEIYTVLVDAFMGLNNKVIGLNSLDEVTNVFASVAEQMLKSRNIIKEISTGFLTGNQDFIINLRATIELYSRTLPNGKFFVRDNSQSLLNSIQAVQRDLKANSNFKDIPSVMETWNRLYDKLNLLINKNYDDVVILPPASIRAGLDLHNTGAIHEALMQAAEGALPSTTQIIADGANLVKFFSSVNTNAKFDVAVLDVVQDVADYAAKIYDKIYFKELLEKHATSINNVWKDILNNLNRYAKSEKTSRFLKEFIHILSSTAGLPALEKYCLLKVILQNNVFTKFKDEAAVMLQDSLHNIINTPANTGLKEALSNFSKYTNKPVTMNTGYDIARSLDFNSIEDTYHNLININDLDVAQHQINRGLYSLENQINDLSNADPMKYVHIKQTKALQQLYEKHIIPFKEEVKGKISSIDISANLQAAAKFLDTKDLETVQQIYSFVRDIPYEDLERLERNIDVYNQTCLNTKQFASKLKALQAFGTVEMHSADQSSELINTYIKFMTDPNIDLNMPEYYDFVQQYGKLLRNEPLPNFIRKTLQKDIKYLNFTNLNINWEALVGGGSSNTYDTLIKLNAGAIFNEKKIITTYKHEVLHNALNHMSNVERGRFVNQVFENCLKTDKEMTETYYKVIWERYNYEHKSNDTPYFRYNNKQFNYANVHIKEEFLAQIISHSHDLKHLQQGMASYAMHIDKQDLVAKVLQRPFKASSSFLESLEVAYNSVIEKAMQSFAKQDTLVPYLRLGNPFDIEKPFKNAEELIKNIQQTNNNRTHYMIRKRLQQSPEELAKDLARTGPFQFYSISTIHNLRSKYGPYYYFDTNFNLRPDRVAELEKFGVHVLKLDELDTILFYIDKNKVYFDGASYYNKSRVDFTPEQFNWEGPMASAGKDFNQAMYTVTGQTLGYSNGFRADKNFYNTLFKGIQNSFESDFKPWPGLDNFNKGLGGWTLEDLTNNSYYSTYRFNEMVMGNNSYMRRFGIYQSPNPYVNMSNALQQAQMMNKTKTELLTTFFDNSFSTGKEGVWGQYSAEQLFKAYQDHPEMVLITLRGKANGTSYRIQEFIPYNIADMQKAKEMGARFVPKSWYNLMHNVLNNRIGSKGLLKWFNRYNFIYKFFTLSTNLMTFIRNAFDTYGKNVIELGEEMPHWTSYAWQIQNDYQNVNNALRQLGKFSEKDIKEFFSSGMSKAYAKANNFTYEMYKDLKYYEAWGPSTSGLADLVNNAKLDPNNPRILRTNGALSDSTLATLEPTNDELMRMIARDTVPGYKGLWENATDMSSQYFDFMNNTVGLKAEKTNRLALYLKATAEGKTREQAFQWIRDVHFDYSTRTTFEQALELIFPFITFTMKNAEYWMRAIENTPWVQRYLADYLQTQINYYDFDNNERAASEQWQYLIKSGNIPLWKTEDNIQAYFKLNPSFMDAFNTFINPIEVLKDRILLPTRAIEKATTTDYKGQNLMGKQPVWNQILDWTSFFPGNALARRITNAVKQPDTFSALTNDAIGKMKMYKPYVPKQYSTKFVYNKDFTSRQLQTKVYNNNYSTYKQGQYQRVRSEIAKQKRLNRLGMGYKITEPYNTTLRNVQGTTYFKMKLPTAQLPMPKADSNYLRLAKYRVQRGYFNR